MILLPRYTNKAEKDDLILLSGGAFFDAQTVFSLFSTFQDLRLAVLTKLCIDARGLFG